MEAKNPIRLQRCATVSNLLSQVHTMFATGNAQMNASNLLSKQHADMMERFQLRQLQPGTRATNGAISSRQPGASTRERVHREFTAPTMTSTDESRVMSSALQKMAPIASMVQFHVRQMRRTVENQMNALIPPFSPFGWTTIARHSITMVTLGVYLLWVPFKHAYTGCINAEWVKSLDLVVAMVFLGDWLFTFNTSVVDADGELVTSRWRIARHYLTGWFIPDTLSAFAFYEFVVDCSQFPACCCVAFKLLSLAGRIVHVFVYTELPWYLRAMPNKFKTRMASVYYSRYSDLPRIVWTVGLSLLFAHYVACIWKMLRDPESDYAQSHSFAEDYSLMLFDALQLLLGQGLATDSASQRVFGPFVIIIGSLFLALEFGDVAVMISNFNASTTEYRSKMESVMAIMDRNNLPLLLQDRILQYYEYLWKEYKCLDGNMIMQQLSTELTHTLKVEVVLSKCAKLILRVPFWKDCSSDFVKQLMLCVTMRVYLPDDFVIRCDEIGDEFYMVSRGSCELVTGLDDPGRTIHTRRRSLPSPLLHQPRSTLLESGDSFGEMALVMNYLHSADVHSVSYVEMCVLSRRDFQALLVRFPSDRKLVLSSLVHSFMRKNALHQKPCPLLTMVRRLLEDEEMGLEQAAALLLQAMDDGTVQDESVMFGLDANFTLRTPVPEEVVADHATMKEEEGSDSEPLEEGDALRREAMMALSQRLTRMEQVQAQMAELLHGIHLELATFRALQRCN